VSSRAFCDGLIVGGTGHRPDKLGGYGKNPTAVAIAAAAGAELDRLRPALVLSGMALGFDQWLAWLAVRRSIPFVACVPFEGQERRWKAEQQSAYRVLLAKAEDVVHVCGPGYAGWKMQRRNEYMVDGCGTLLAAWDGTDGGTANCVRYAQRVGRDLTVIDVARITREVNGRECRRRDSK
jgi:uncharacterized phage-like protein YoqJ